MDLTIRRIAYGLAFAIFFIVAPIVLALTAGYRWQGFETGFVQTGVIIVQSQPRTTVFLNDESVGQTPKRIVGLRPGSYKLELQRIGYRPWEHIVSVTASTATIVNPVLLFPESLLQEIVIPTAEDIFTDTATRMIFEKRSVQSGTVVRTIWPAGIPSEWILPFVPETAVVSTRQRYALFQSDLHAAIVDLNQPMDFWEVEPIMTPQWDQSAEAVVLGLRDQDLVRLDALTQTQTPIAVASSFGLVNDQLWYAQATSEATPLYQRQTLGASAARLVQTLAGQREIIPGPNQFITRDLRTRTASLHQFTPLTQQLTSQALGTVDQQFWSEQGLLWISGVNLYSLLDGRVTLIERSPTRWRDVAWIDPGHILYSVSGDAFHIRSVSTRQGVETLLEASLGDAQAVLFKDVVAEYAIIHDTSTNSVSRRSWGPDAIE